MRAPMTFLTPKRAAKRSLGAVLLAVGLIATAPLVPDPDARAQVPADDPPNILLIVTDDQRAGSLDVMDRTRRFFRKGGRRFPNAYATSPLCCPSRASIMTGRYPHNHEVRQNDDAANLIQETTLQYYLKQSGYLTGVAGKYLNSWKEAEADPPYFDRWAVIDDTSYGKVYRKFIANVDGKVVRPGGYSTSFIADRSIDMLASFEEDDRRPWFMYVAPFAAHKPFVPHPRYRNALTPAWFGNPAVGESDRSDKPPWVQDRRVRLPGGRAVARVQYRTLMSADDMVARITKALKAYGEKQETLAIFISDNGYLWGEHGLASKRFPYTAAVEVPLYVRWPGEIKARSVDERLAANIDIAPTIAEIVGFTPAPEHPMDGRSLFAPEVREKILLEYFAGGLGNVPPWASLRSATYQYVEYGDARVPTFREYYDLELDPFQLENLLGDGDPTNDPAGALLTTDLQQARQCRGTACP